MKGINKALVLTRRKEIRNKWRHFRPVARQEIFKLEPQRWKEARVAKTWGEVDSGRRHSKWNRQGGASMAHSRIKKVKLARGSQVQQPSSGPLVHPLKLPSLGLWPCVRAPMAWFVENNKNPQHVWGSCPGPDTTPLTPFSNFILTITF